MRLNLVFLSLILGVCIGCAASPGIRPIGSGKATVVDDDGTPGWVRRGSTALTGDGGRVFYGVGSASGIRNPGLLRTTVDNRARAELAKVFEAFSASLMKDFEDSSGAQNVEQVIRTFSAQTLKGAEVVDRYIDRSGTVYALASLDLKQVDSTHLAERVGLSRGHRADASLEQIFDENAERARSAGPLKGDRGGSSELIELRPKASRVNTEESRGARPDWIDGEDPSYPYRAYLCGVGYGPNRQIAEDTAFAAIARVFVARVESTADDFMGAYVGTGAANLEVSSTEVVTRVSTEKVFTGIEVPRRWVDDDGGVFALACLSRARASVSLTEQIGLADARARRHLENAQRVDKASRVAELSHALDALIHREALNAELRIVDADGIGVPGALSHADVAAAFEAAVLELKIGVQVTGAHASEFRGELVSALKRAGYHVLDQGSGESLDVLVDARIAVEDGGKGTGRASHIHFARASIEVEVKNPGRGTVLGAFVEHRKDGSRNLAEAQRLAILRLGKKIANKVGPKIDAAMKGQ